MFKKIINSLIEFNHELPNDYFGNSFGLFDSKLLYCVIRKFKPSYIIEFSPYKGWTSSILIDAVKKQNNFCEIYSFDLLSDSSIYDIESEKIKRKLFVGDVKETIFNCEIEKCDFMFIDSDHSYEFGLWYCTEVLPKLKSGTLMWIHDWPTYNSNGAKRNMLPKLNMDNNSEPFAVKENFINKNLGFPILNTTDYFFKILDENQLKNDDYEIFDLIYNKKIKLITDNKDYLKNSLSQILIKG